MHVMSIAMSICYVSHLSLSVAHVGVCDRYISAVSDYCTCATSLSWFFFSRTLFSNRVIYSRVVGIHGLPFLISCAAHVCIWMGYRFLSRSTVAQYNKYAQERGHCITHHHTHTSHLIQNILSICHTIYPFFHYHNKINVLCNLIQRVTLQTWKRTHIFDIWAGSI